MITNAGSSSSSVFNGGDIPLVLVDRKKGFYKINKEAGIDRRGIKVYEAVYCAKDSSYLESKQVLGLYVVPDGEEDFGTVFKEVIKNTNCDHVNILEVKDFFYFDSHLTVAIPLQEVKSMRYLMAAEPKFRDGLPEDCIATVLRETIYGLSCVHMEGDAHGRISAGNVFFDSRDHNVKIGYGASSFYRDEEKRSARTSQYPLWTAEVWGGPPESYNNPEGLKTASDTWLIGVLALELAFGDFKMYERDDFLGFIRWVTTARRLPNKGEEWKIGQANEEDGRKLWKRLHHLKVVAARYVNPRYLIAKSCSRGFKLRTESTDNEIKMKGLKVLKSVKNKLYKIPMMSYFNNKKRVVKNEYRSSFSKSFGMMVADCLSDDPDMRPALWDLLQYEFFRQGKSVKYFEDVVVDRNTDPSWCVEKFSSNEDSAV
ncbi:hypothetical protein POM88_024452 [Heracleum sosnowskyi]|uniref:Protein kinase domain-containing protein n=1 Tax=Heracleum sosnowskyi TaxID=360622 RepID=A0AAD8I2W5_9APIA|nr:hypothetical protein POM88_024452 [Heracleum sosnowskyi]